MNKIHKLLQQLEAQEKLLHDTEFIAPCLQGSSIKTSVDNIIYTFKTEPENFEGWGIFKPIDNQTAEVIDEASLPQLSRYLKLLKPLRLRLAYQLQRQSWLAYPINESDSLQRFNILKPVVVHLVTEGSNFETIIARFDGGNFWFEEIDRKADIQPTMTLAEKLREETLPDDLKFSGMTPEMLIVYDLAWQQTETARRQREDRRRVKLSKNSPPKHKKRKALNITATDEQRLQEALKQRGAILETFRDKDDFWLVEWRTSKGESHSSAINKNDLTVITSGICLSGKDQDFDLQSLVGVIEKQNFY